MIRRTAEVVELEDDDFAARDGDVAVGGEATDPVVHRGCRRRVIHIDVSVRGERWIECHTEKAALTCSADGDRDEWGG